MNVRVGPLRKLNAKELMVLNCGVGEDSWKSLDYKSWTYKKVLDYKKIKPVNPKGDHSWIFIGRTNAAAEAPIIWPPDANSQLIRKYPDGGKDWRQEEKGTREAKMVGWHHWFNGQTPGDSEGQGGLVCCSPLGHKELDMTEQLKNNNSQEE